MTFGIPDSTPLHSRLLILSSGFQLRCEFCCHIKIEPNVRHFPGGTVPEFAVQQTATALLDRAALPHPLHFQLCSFCSQLRMILLLGA